MINPSTGVPVDPMIIAEQEARQMALLNSQLAGHPSTAYQAEAMARLQLEKARQQRMEQERQMRAMADARAQAMTTSTPVMMAY